MQSTSEGFLNIAELANQLRREKIFINSERHLLQNLNEEVEKSALELLQAAWVCSQQRQNLTSLITSRSETDSVAACQRASQLESTTFIDVHKVLKFKESNVLGELLGWLRDSPHLVALCLLLGEDHMPPTLPSSLVAGLYGSCRSAVDRTRFLAVLRSLIKHQLAPAPDPCKLFRTGRCALAQLFAVFRDGHTPARQFLVAALSGPIMSVLHEDEFFLDIDPDKAMERFSLTDRQKKFGQTNSAEYATKVGRYRKWTIQSLYNLTSQFISSLRENWGSFPPALAWIIQQISHLVKQHSRASERELHALCADIVFTHFICPAVVRPETHGVVETPVSHIARSNLTQIAQILQVLALDNYQEVDPKARDLYAKFDRTSVPSLLLSTGAAGTEPAPPPPPEAALRTEPPAPRAIALYTAKDLQDTITFLKRISSKLNNNTPSVTSEEASSSSAGAVAEAAAYSEAGSDGSSSDEGCATDLAALLQSLEPNYKSRLHDLLRKTPDLSNVNPPSPEKEPHENGLKRSILAKVPKPRIPRSASFNSPLHTEVNGETRGEAGEHPVVMVIRLANSEEHDYVGMVPESKVLECYYGGSEAGDADETGSALAVAGPATVQKRTRFSLSHVSDEVSLGNTSDNLEAVSEAASNHSVTSSLELEPEDQNDNLSDMVSANVSGRGSPNISGRETPSSQVTDGDAANEGPRRMPPTPVSAVQAANAQKLLKQARNDIEDKFCKFEIKKLLEGDETISIMSDTWSTDVLASDSETIGDAEQQPPAGQATSGGPNAPDVSETASESAWSMDVLASDSDRNTEVDTDDCVSVAARSDTSWPRRPSHHDDAPAPPHVQTPKRPDLNSPRHTSRLTNRSGGYLSATAALSRGGELDLPTRAPPPPHAFTALENRKSILVNGYPVMTCYANSAPESPSTSAPAPLPSDVFDYGGPSSSYGAATDSTLEGNNSDATSQWVDDSFPRAAATPPDNDADNDDRFDAAADNKSFDEFPNYNPPADELLDRSLNSSESSFNALSVSHYDRRFDSGIDTERPSESRSTITDLMTRMSSATISTSNLVNNITSRIVKSEIRTSIVSISSSRVDKKGPGSQPVGNMSLSTLSVNSAESSDKSSSQDVASDVATERRVSPPPKTSTGAIPKSISFDATAEKSSRRRLTGEEGLASNLDELKNNVKRSGGNLLHRIKMFRQKGRHHAGGDVKVCEEEVRCEETVGVTVREAESSEDILAKYRRRASTDGKARRVARPPQAEPMLDRSEGVVDLADPEVFNSMKRKLRLVLSNPDLHCVEYIPNRCTSTSLTEWIRAASACAGSEESAAHAGELARALAGAGADSARLAAALRADLAARRPYAAYLASCRAGLTHTLHVLNRQVRLARSEGAGAARAAAAARVLEQLERGAALRRLHARHSRRDHRASTEGELMDEKASRLTATIKAITAEVKADPSWDGASPALLEAAETAVERAVFAKLYLHVMFPNGDGDIARDQVLSEHIRRLGATTSARGLGVAPRHLWAAPFPRAQRHLRRLCVARAPKDKVSCIMRCVTCVMAVLGLTEGGAPAADDLTPVLVYIILRVNPPSLLSTIELVNALGGAALAGEALYWWTHFCAAVAYIKTMDYPRDS